MALLIDDQEVTMYDQIAYYSVLTQQRLAAERSAGRSVRVSGRELSRSRRSRRSRRRTQ